MEAERLGRALETFVQYLPDIDIVSNQHDECRIILPHEDLARHLRSPKVRRAKGLCQQNRG